MQNTASGLYNVISLIFLALSVVFVVFVGVQLSSPPPEDAPIDVAALPTIQELPTATPEPPTQTPRPTLPPTFTPTPTDTATPSRTPTPTITVPPSPTITDTPTEGPTLTPSETPLPPEQQTQQAQQQTGQQQNQQNQQQPTPIGPTPVPSPTTSPFLFAAQSQGITFGPNGVNALGCQWQGVGGSVLDQNGVELGGVQYVVRVFDRESFETTVATGTNSLYGQLTGWEITVSNTINSRNYFARLETSLGTAISPDIQITFPGDCNSNAAVLRFVQQRANNPAQQPAQQPPAQQPPAQQPPAQQPPNNQPPFAPPVTTEESGPPFGG